MGKRGRPLKADKRDDSYRLRLNAEERQMLTQISEWTEQPIAAVIRTALYSYYSKIREKNMLYYEKKEDQTGYPRLRDLVVERQLKNESRM